MSKATNRRVYSLSLKGLSKYRDPVSIKNPMTSSLSALTHLLERRISTCPKDSPVLSAVPHLLDYFKFLNSTFPFI